MECKREKKALTKEKRKLFCFMLIAQKKLFKILVFYQCGNCFQEKCLTKNGCESWALETWKVESKSLLAFNIKSFLFQ
jgi:hypothetical protein